MTHCTGYRGVAVARDNLLAAVGIDAEPHEALPGSGLRHISSQIERAQLAGRRSDVHWDRLIFCAKEATYKACYPLLRRRLDFTDVRIEFRAAEGTLQAELLTPHPYCMGGNSQSSTGAG